MIPLLWDVAVMLAFAWLGTLALVLAWVATCELQEYRRRRQIARRGRSVRTSSLPELTGGAPLTISDCRRVHR